MASSFLHITTPAQWNPVGLGQRSKSATTKSRPLVGLDQRSIPKGLCNSDDFRHCLSLADLHLATRSDGVICVRAFSCSHMPITTVATQPDATRTVEHAPAASAQLEVQALPAVTASRDESSTVDTGSAQHGAATRAARMRRSTAALVKRAGRAVGKGLSCLRTTMWDGMQSYVYASQYYVPHPGGAWHTAQTPVYPLGAF
jgi:hypothetical protein